MNSYKKVAIVIFLFFSISLLFTACNKTRQFDIALFFKEYGLNLQSAQIIKSERVRCDGSVFAVGEFYISVEKWNILILELKEKYCLIDHFQKGDAIDGRNKKILNITSGLYEIYPFQIYSANVYFYVENQGDCMYIRCLIDFNR